MPLEVFGFWPVEVYVPPPAVNRKVPRNEYVNVELYKPKSTAHLKLPVLNLVVRNLGFDSSRGMI